MDRFTAALIFAAQAHEGQVYRGYNGRPDEPYIFHPIRVAMAVSARCQVVALLHDVFEDTDAVAPDWLDDEEHRALNLLTWIKKREAYQDYIERLTYARGLSGDIAREVKRADLRENLAHDPPEHLEGRYRWALGHLTTSQGGTT